MQAVTRIQAFILSNLGFPGGSVVKKKKKSTGQCRRHGFNPWVWKIPWRRKWQPISVFLPGESPWTEEPGWLNNLSNIGSCWKVLIRDLTCCGLAFKRSHWLFCKSRLQRRKGRSKKIIQSYCKKKQTKNPGNKVTFCLRNAWLPKLKQNSSKKKSKLTY